MFRRVYHKQIHMRTTHKYGKVVSFAEAVVIFSELIQQIKFLNKA